MGRLPTILFVTLGVAALWIGFLRYAEPGPARDDGAEAPRASPAPEPPMLVPYGTPPAAVREDSVEAPESEPSARLALGDPEREPGPGPDPIRNGPCALVLHLTAEGSGEAMHGAVDLWRIDAPLNPGWTAGDQRQARATLAEGTVRFAKLPPGRYRIFAHGQRVGSGDPAAFEVAGARTELRFELPGPERRQVHVRLLDERGDVIESARRTDGGAGGFSSPPGPPVWVTARTWTQGIRPLTWRGRGFSTTCCGGGSRVVWGDIRGFDWGTVLDDVRAGSKDTSHELCVEGRSTLRVTVRGDVARAHTYVGVAVPLELVYDRVLLPTGERAIDQGATIHVESEAVLETEATPPDIQRSLPIQVEVEAAGTDPIRFEFTLEDLDWVKTLQPTTGE